jgi:hypothetical protein
MTSTITRARTVTVEADPFIEELTERLDDQRAQADLDARREELVAKAAAKYPTKEARLQARAEAVAEAAGRDAWGDPLYTREDVLSWVGRCLDHDCAPPRLAPSDVDQLARLVIVPNAKLREAYEREAELRDGEDPPLVTQLARAIGAGSWGKPDVSYVKRLLGIVPSTGGSNYAPTLRVFMPYDHAALMAAELNLDYQTLGI